MNIKILSIRALAEFEPNMIMFRIHVSEVAFGPVLTQVHSNERPSAFASRTITSADCGFSIGEPETRV